MTGLDINYKTLLWVLLFTKNVILPIQRVICKTENEYYVIVMHMHLITIVLIKYSYNVFVDTTF